MHHGATRRWDPRPIMVATLVALATHLGGCVVVVGSPLGFLGRGAAPLEEVTVDGDGKAKLVLIDVGGLISDQPERRAFGLVEGESMVARIEAELTKATDDRRVRGLVLHVRSPGGAVTASDDIYRAVRRFAAERKVPVVAALGGVATSGGYYVACAGDRIVAHPTGITGSIGVVMINLNVHGLLEKIGVEDTTVTTGAHKDMLSPFKTPDPVEREIAARVLTTLHERFLAVIRERRPAIDDATLRGVADGRILDAERAVAVGLADRVGDLHDAIETARALAGEPKARVVRYRRGGETTETLHARWRGRDGAGVASADDALRHAAQALDAAGPRLLYLWMPAAGLTRFGEPR